MVNSVSPILPNTASATPQAKVDAILELIQQGKEKEAVAGLDKVSLREFESIWQTECLFFAAAKKRLKAVVEALIDYVYTDALSPLKQTPLMIVAELHLPKCALRLVQRSSSLTITDTRKESAFSYLTRYLEHDFVNEFICTESVVRNWDVQTKGTLELMRFLRTQDRVSELKSVQDRARAAKPSWWQEGMEQSKKQLEKTLLVLVYQYGSNGQLVDKQTGKQQAELLKQEILKCKEEHFVYGYSPTLIVAHITNKRADALEKMHELLARITLSPSQAAAFAFIAMSHGQERYIELFKKIAVGDPKAQLGQLWLSIFFNGLQTKSFSKLGAFFLNFSAEQKRLIFTNIPAATHEIFTSFNALWDKPCGDQFYVLIDRVCTENPDWWQRALEGRTDLFITMLGSGHKKTARILAEKGAIDVRRYEASQQQTPLMLAALYGDETLVELLLRQKAGLEDLDKNNTTALSYILKRFSPEFVRRVIEEKFLENDSFHGSDTGVILAELFVNNNEKLAMQLLERLLEMKKEPNWLKTRSAIGYVLFMGVSKCVKKYSEYQEIGAQIAAALSPYVSFSSTNKNGLPQAIDVALEQNWQAAVWVLLQSDFKEVWSSLREDQSQKSFIDAICSKWDEEMFWDIVNGVDIEEETVSQLMKDFALLRAPIAVRLFEKLEREQPEWWKKKGSKETWFNKLIRTTGASPALLERFAQVIDMDYDDDEDDEFAPPIIAAAQAGLQNVVQVFITRGCDLSKVKNYDEKSVFEYIEESFRQDALFVQKLLEQCTDESLVWLKSYNNLLVLLSQKKNDEVLTLLQQAGEPSLKPTWMSDPKRLSVIYNLAQENGSKDIVKMVIGAMNVVDGEGVLKSLIARQWEDLVLELFKNENVSDEQQCAMFTLILRHYASQPTQLEEFIQGIPVTNKGMRHLLQILLQEKNKDKALLLFKKCCSQPVPRWLNTTRRLELFKAAGECDATELAELIVQGNEIAFFEDGGDSFLQIAVKAGWKEIAADLIVKGADILHGLLPCYETAEKAFGEEFIILAVEQCVVTSQQAAQDIMWALAKKKKIKVVESFCKRFMTNAVDSPAWAKTALFKTNCLIPLVAEKAWDTLSLELVVQGANLSSQFANGTTTIESIEKQRDEAFVTSLLEHMVLEQQSSINLLIDLLKRGQKAYAALLFKRISDPVRGVSWYKEKTAATTLFDYAARYNEIEIAQAVVEFTALEKQKTQYVSSLVYLAKTRQGAAWEALAKRLVERGAREDTCQKGCSCFSIVKKAFPRIAEMMIETYPIEKDSSAFLLSLLDQQLLEEAYALYGRIFSTSPAWWTKKAKMAFFFALAPRVQDSYARSLLESLIDDDAFTVDERDKGKTPLMAACENSFPTAVVQKILNKGDDTQLLKLDRAGNSAFSYFIKNKVLATALIQQQQVQTFLKRIGLNGYLVYQDICNALQTKRNFKGKDFNRSIAAVTGAHESLRASLQDQSFNFKYWTINQLLKPEMLTSEYETILVNAAFTVDTTHYKADVMPKAEIAVDSKTTLEEMKKLFMAYAEDTKDVRYIDTFITRIRDRIADVATPAGKGALEEFYKTIQNQVLVVIEYFNREIAKIETNGVTLQNAAQEHIEGAKELLSLLREWLRTAQDASQYCAARLQDHAREYYTRCIRKQKYDMKTFVLGDLAEVRNLLIQSFSKGTQSVHVYNGFTSLYGEEFGLPGFEEAQKFQDKWISQHRSEIETAKRQLIQRYTPAFLLEHMRFVLKEQHLKFVDFLEHLDTAERKSLDSHLVQFIAGKVRGLWAQNTSLETNQKKVRDYLEAAPYYIYLDDKEYASKEKVMAALEKDEHKARAIYALADKDSGYSWTGVALLLLALKVLK